MIDDVVSQCGISHKFLGAINSKFDALMFQKPDNFGNIGGGFSFVFVSCSPLLSEKLSFDEHIFSTGLKPPTFR